MTLADPFAWLVLLAVMIWFDRSRWQKLFRAGLTGANRPGFRYRERD